MTPYLVCGQCRHFTGEPYGLQFTIWKRCAAKGCGVMADTTAAEFCEHFLPPRIQLRRTRGWKKPEGAVVVSRPSKWGKANAPGLSSAEWQLGRRGDNEHWIRYREASWWKVIFKTYGPKVVTVACVVALCSVWLLCDLSGEANAAVLIAILCGFAFGRQATAALEAELRSEIERRENEIDRTSERNQELEKMILSSRQSSVPSGKSKKEKK